MDPVRYRRIKELFNEARDLSSEDRRGFLDTSCGADAELLREVEELLASDEASRGGALGRALDDEAPSVAAAPAPGPPERIGRYRILRVCGYGGMGTVYEAEQDSPRRRVALKVIQAGDSRDEVLSRFRREAEILGRLQHPGIAQVFEAGEFSREGRTLPFIAMEFLAGLPLVEHARRHGLSTDQRVELFARVCEAVDHAHRQGVVHRDLKPDNVLVIEDPSASGQPTLALGQPKVLDFGVARLTCSDLHVTRATGAGELLGSVPYMSPEQASGRPDRIDARSDLYSLGVLLFELLAERLPHELKNRPLADALDTIRNAEPARLGSVRPELHGDLDTIVGKCLEKERERRYPSAAALVVELRRHLRHEPIAARPPSTWYQLTKFARRHRAVVGGALATLATLVVGIVVSLVLAFDAKRNERRAEEASDASRREAYRANLSAASALLGADPLAARGPLDAVPEERRGWEWRYLDSRLAGHALELGGGRALEREGPLVAFDDGRRVAALIDDQTLGVWDLESGRELERIPAPETASAWAVSGDGSRVAVGTEAGRVFVRDRAGEWERWLVGEHAVVSLAFDPAAERLALFAGEELALGRPGSWLRTSFPSERARPRLGFSPDGARLLAVHYTKTDTGLALRDATSLAQLAARWSPGAPACFAFSPDGELLALGEEYREIELCDAADLSPRRKLLGHQRRVTDVQFDGAGRLVSASPDGTIRLWDLDSGTNPTVLAEPDVRAVTFDGGGRLISAAPEHLRLRELQTPSARVLGGHANYVYELAYSADGGWLASYVRHGRELSVWDPRSGELLRRMPAVGWVDQLGFEPGAARIWMRGGTESQSVCWAAPSGSSPTFSLGPPVRHFLRYRVDVLDLEFALSDELELGDELALYRTVHGVGADASAVRAFRNGAELALHQDAGSRTGHVELGEHPRLFLGAWGDRTDFSFRGHLAELIVYSGEPAEAEAAAVERYLAARRAGGASEFPALRSARLLAHFRADEASVLRDAQGLQITGWRATNDRSLTLERHGAPGDVIRYRPAAAPLACDTLEFENGGPSAFWLEAAFPAARGALPITVFWLGEYESGVANSCCYSVGSYARALDVLRDPDQPYVGTTFSLDAAGRRVATGAQRRGVPSIVRELATGAVIGAFGERVFGVALSPDGQQLATGEATGRVDRWRIADGALLASADDHGGEVYAVAWSPDGARVATGGNDSAVVIRDAQTLEPLLELRGHAQYVKALAFSPDGTQLASASGDRTVRLWDTLPASERHAQVLAARALEDEVRARVEAWLAETREAVRVADRIIATFADDPERERAALKVLARVAR